MKCPACSNTLSELKAGEVTVDVCRGGCGGVWFDDREIRAFDEKREMEAVKILEVEHAPNVQINTGVRYCPKCPKEVLCRRFYDIKNEVTIDQCLRCSGIWLDVGELAQIRDQYESERDRYTAADKYLEGHLHSAEDAIAQGYETRLKQWHEDSTFKGTLRHLFAGFFGID